MARDEIEWAYKLWARDWPVPETTHGASFRAGAVWALRRAEKIARNAGREGTLLRTPNSIEVHTADRIADAIASILGESTEREGE